jgi:low affinity Fe/Cu permease
MLIFCYRDRRLKFALFPVIKSMNDAKAMQIESDSMMARVWRDYLMTVGMMFSIIPMMRFSNAEWFAILTETSIGKLLIVVMLMTALATSFYVMKVTKPVNK